VDMDKIKFHGAGQANVYQCKNIREKIHRTIAAMWCNKMCKTFRLTAKFVHNKIKIY